MTGAELGPAEGGFKRIVLPHVVSGSAHTFKNIVGNGGLADVAESSRQMAGDRAATAFDQNCQNVRSIEDHGKRRAFEFLVRNGNWNAEEALDAGLINEIVADETALRDAAQSLAAEIAAGPTLAYGGIKRLFLSSFEQPLEAQLDAEARALAEVSRSDDAWNALNAVLVKEKPAFAGR